jgi:hypothetical protein
MSRSSDPRRAPRPAALFLAGFAVAAVAVVAAAAGPLASPAVAPGTAQPSAAPSAPPATPPPATRPPATPVPVTPTAEPSDPGTDAMPITIELETVDRSDVSVDIVDRTGSLVAAATGHPAEGMSAEGLAVVNLGANRLRLTWVDFGIDNRLALFVDEVDGHLRLAMIQPPPTAPTDAMGFDRVLDLTFDRAVDASDVEAILQDGLDTPG